MTVDIPRPWLEHYPNGVETEIDPAPLGTVVDVFEKSVADFGPRPALESFGVRLTYAEIGDIAKKAAAALQKFGLKKGDRAAIMMPNVMAYPPLVFGILMAGGVVVNVNPLYTPRELAHQLNDSGARIVFVLENFAHTVAEALNELKTLETAVVVSPGDLLGFKGMVVNAVSRWIKRSVKAFSLPSSMRFADFERVGAHAAFTPVEIGREDPAFLQYTGGTTGVSKGAVLLHRNIVANVLQCEKWMVPFFGERDDHVMYTALPLYHILALTGSCLFMVKIGACQVLIANPRDIDGLAKLFKSRPPTLVVMVNTLYNVLAQHPGMKDLDFSRLAACISGGMATQAAVAKRWKELTGKPIIEGYGLSETSPVVCVNRLDIEEWTGTIGYPVASTDVSVRSPDGDLVPLGEAGELCVKGPQVMAGYWQRPDETAKVMTDDGFFRTGDVAVLQPDGEVKIVDRLKDMIAVSGLKVFPNEVEDVLASHPKVLEAAVIGVPDEHSGEAVAAYIVPREGETATADEIRTFAREKLTSYKVPKIVEFRDALPKTNVGKILRRELRDEVIAAGK
ncbi:MAG: AMP-binding protein [Beijerinckiaceae bacterium]